MAKSMFVVSYTEANKAEITHTQNTLFVWLGNGRSAVGYPLVWPVYCLFLLFPHVPRAGPMISLSSHMGRMMLKDYLSMESDTI
jgi:hypothetical protein